jgi:hypothetical protein
MLKINNFIFALFTAVSLSTPALASDCSALNDAMNRAYDNANEMAVSQVEGIMKKPDLSPLESCLGGLSGSLGGFTLPGIPDLNDLLSQACDAVVDIVYDKAMATVGEDLKDLDISASRTGEYGFEMQEPDVQIREPDIDLQKSIENIFN